MKNKDEANAVNETGSAAGGSSISAVLLEILLNLLIVGSLDPVWQMLNGIQVIHQILIFNAKTPGNINTFANYFDFLADAELVEYDQYMSDVIYIPEQDPYSLNLMNAGHHSILFLVNTAGFLSVFSFFILTSTLGIIIGTCFGRCSVRARQLRSMATNNLFWKSTIRLFIEAYLDLSLYAMINIKEAEWPDGLHAVTASNY